MKSKRVTALLLTGATLAGMTLGGCGNKIQDDAVFATMGDTTITMGVANLFAKYEQAIYDSYYMSYFGEDMWNSDLYGNGSTLSDDVKGNVEEELQKMYLLKAHMEEYGITIGDEEEAAIEKAADDFIAANTKEAIAQIGAENKENVKEMLRLYTIQKKMHDRIIEDAEVEVTDEEAAQRSFSYVSVAPDHTHEEEGEEGHPEEEMAALKAVADTIAAAEDFDKAVTDAGYTVSTASYGSAADESSAFDAAVLEAADALKEGEVSGVVELESGYYVLRLDSEHDEEATQAKKEQLISQKQEDFYNDIIDGWKEEEAYSPYEINEDEWKKVVFVDRFKAPEQETETESGTEQIDAAGTEAAIEPTESVESTEAQ